MGLDFIHWVWEPVEGATGYDTHTYSGDIQDQEPHREHVQENVLRVDGFEPNTVVELFVRAVRNREVGPWSDRATTTTMGTPRECTDELEQAMNYSVSLPAEWDGRTPFLFYFDSASLPEGEQEDAEHVLATVERLSARIEEQIGYSIIEVGGWTRLPSQDCDAIRDLRESGQIVAQVMAEDYVNPNTGEVQVGIAQAWRRCNAVRYWSGDVKVVKDSIAPHEIFHLFGFAHSRTPTRHGTLHPNQHPVGEGISMSNPLTHGTTPPDLGVTFADVDALRCIFPQ